MKKTILHGIFTTFLLMVSGLAPAQGKPVKTYSKDGVSVKAYDFNGLKQFLEQKSDSVYVVNFWATWCAPCVAELPHFEALPEQFKEQKIKVLLVSLDFTKSVEKSLLPFIQRKNIQSDVVLLSDPDANSWIEKVDASWSGAIPATLIYSPSKNLRKFYEQSFTSEQLQTEIKNFL